MSMIRWKCPKCKHWWWVSDRYPRREVFCFECGEAFILKEVLI